VDYVPDGELVAEERGIRGIVTLVVMGLGW